MRRIHRVLVAAVAAVAVAGVGTAMVIATVPSDDAAAVSGPDADRARAAALAAVPGGRVRAVERHTPGADTDEQDADTGRDADGNEDPRTAYEVVLTRAGASPVDVRLDRTFTVLGVAAVTAEHDDDGD